MKVCDICGGRGGDVVSVRPEESILTIARIMAANNLGCIPVLTADNTLVGMLSERDLVRSLAKRARALKAADLMTENVITCSPGEDLRSAMEKMTRHHVRYLPVTVEGELVGIVSCRDLLQAVLSEMITEQGHEMEGISVAR